jgi:hypothetical protein
MFPNNFVQQLVDALLHVLITIGRVFVLPLNLWIKSTTKLVGQKQDAALDMNTIQSAWPCFSWIKRWILDFFFNACAFLSYPIGVLAAIYAFFDYVGTSFGIAVEDFLVTLIVAYFFPLFISFAHDCIVFMLLPITKLIDWLKKPAQYLELKNNEK